MKTITTKTYFGWLVESRNTKNGQEKTLSTCKRHDGQVKSILRETSTKEGKGVVIQTLGATTGSLIYGKVRGTRKKMEELHQKSIEWFERGDF